jgi:hypothetical protein
MEYYDLNNKITNLWKAYNIKFDDYFNVIMKRSPNYLNKPNSNNKILFIGLNPSFQKRNEKHKDFIDYSFNPNVTKEEIINFCKINYYSKVKSPTNKLYYRKYFEVLHKFADSLGEKDGFEHCDLFFMRETNSKIVKKMVEETNGDLNKFGKEQLKILKFYITNLNPRAIIIPNALASRYYKQTILQNSIYDGKKGIYYSKFNNKKIPTILCGSWQYGRLDEYTKLILVKHIKAALE